MGWSLTCRTTRTADAAGVELVVGHHIESAPKIGGDVPGHRLREAGAQSEIVTAAEVAAGTDARKIGMTTAGEGKLFVASAFCATLFQSSPSPCVALYHVPVVLPLAVLTTELSYLDLSFRSVLPY